MLPWVRELFFGGGGCSSTQGKEVLFLKQPIILSFLLHKSAAAFQIDSSKVSNFKLKQDPCNCVKSEIIEYTALP